MGWLVALEDLGDLGSRFLLEVLSVLGVPTALCVEAGKDLLVHLKMC